MNTIYVDLDQATADGTIRGHKTSARLDERVEVVDLRRDMQCEATVLALSDDGLPTLGIDYSTKTGSGWTQ